jgi:hypothetical protein
MAFAQKSFELSKPVGDGTTTLREHLMQAEKQIGKGKVKELQMPPFPFQLYREWGWFSDLHAARQSSGFGPLPLSYSEMHSYFFLINEKPNPWQMGMLRRLDGVALKHYASLRPKTKPGRSH